MSDSFKSNTFTQVINQTFANIQLNNAFILRMLTISITIILAIAIFAFIYNKLSLRRKECNNMNNLYSDFPKISNVSVRLIGINMN